MKKSAEEMLDELEIKLNDLSKKIDKKLVNKRQPSPENLKKNSHLHIFIETPLMDKLRKEAKEKCMNMSELVRRELRDNTQIDRIEKKIDKLIEKK